MFQTLLQTLKLWKRCFKKVTIWKWFPFLCFILFKQCHLKNKYVSKVIPLCQNYKHQMIFIYLAKKSTLTWKLNSFYWVILSQNLCKFCYSFWPILCPAKAAFDNNKTMAKISWKFVITWPLNLLSVVPNRLVEFAKLDLAKLIFQISSTDQQWKWLLVLLWIV